PWRRAKASAIWLRLLFSMQTKRSFISGVRGRESGVRVETGRRSEVRSQRSGDKGTGRQREWLGVVWGWLGFFEDGLKGDSEDGAGGGGGEVEPEVLGGVADYCRG